MREITTESNWNTSYYQSENLSVRLHLAADANSISYQLAVAQIDGEGIVFQKKFIELEEAIKHLNKNYCQWKFVSLAGGASAKEGACASCEAH